MTALAVIRIASTVGVESAIIINVIGFVVLPLFFIFPTEDGVLALGAELGNELFSLGCGQVGEGVLGELAILPSPKVIHVDGDIVGGVAEGADKFKSGFHSI